MYPPLKRIYVGSIPTAGTKIQCTVMTAGNGQRPFKAPRKLGFDSPTVYHPSVAQW